MLEESIKAVNGKIEKIRERIKDNQCPTDQGMSLLDLKNHLLVDYATHCAFYAKLKVDSTQNVVGHPVFKELVRYRTILERMRPMERKVKYQIDKLVKLAASNGSNHIDIETLECAPRPDELISKQEDQEANDEENPGIYRAPKMASVPYLDQQDEEREDKKAERRRKLHSKSTILTELREEFSERPQELMATGTAALDRELAKEDSERKQYEETRMVRLVMSKKDKTKRRQRERESIRIDSVADIDNFAGVSDALGLDKRKRKPKFDTKKVGGTIGGIFSHVELKGSKKKQRYTQAADQSVAVPAPASTGKSKKQKVAFSSLFD